jgi:hypothetical protein
MKNLAFTHFVDETFRRVTKINGEYGISNHALSQCRPALFGMVFTTLAQEAEFQPGLVGAKSLNCAALAAAAASGALPAEVCHR